MSAIKQQTKEALNEVSCDFCQEIADRRLDGRAAQRYRRATRICRETTTAVVAPSVSPLSKGHVLVIPKAHVRNTRALPVDTKEELLHVLFDTGLQLAARNGEVYLFEHGIGTNSDEHGCGIDHAHVHLIPVGKDLSLRLRAYVPARLQEFRGQAQLMVGQLDRVIRSPEAISGSYLFFGVASEILLYEPINIPSQFMRKTLAELLGRNNWDWRALDNSDDFHATLSLMSA